ncbi:MAG: HAMP domain-containing histidine kinase [Sulfurimonas sp.]|uniref:sensor histidine kinase n=1 Tax=Sulfurimonas sp. TaxID=2022749 RepID=UPI00262A6D1F|nr:HAMP domain-containing sensor histidine kinase [Sulfurimonas sp.]MCW8894563.1 HAMP domain-containing histidine kinase [Sulfurimonas sp.]MCW8953769.1 HAMP domain-containing histidine kinase [Sulfurimonas sp.]MCW9068477.1 HAMP domain-containing histidine kinase [Sulfurimonas sp.]
MKYVFLVLLTFLPLYATQEPLEKNFKYIYEGIFLLIFVLVALFYRQQILKNKNRELEVLKNELMSLNQTLESKISDAVQEAHKKDAYLVHKSRLLQMGEVMSMVAHQWKQPLSSISATQISILLALELESYDFDDKTQRDNFLRFLKSKLDKIGLYTQNLSQIISDFSDYYKPNKDAAILPINKVIAKAYGIIEDSLNSSDIHVVLSLGSSKELNLHENEFMQVILNILNNAKEQFAKCDVENAEILISSYDKDDMAVLEISNNAGQIDDDIIDHIFEPYFSTKLKENGTGLGLHMAKNIIEEHHRGSIKVVNTDDGVKFIIKCEAI